MTFWILVILTLFSTSCLTQRNENDQKYGIKDDNPVRYVTNWDSYQIPKPVLVDILKDILEKVALYKQNRYCPFGENECEPSKVGLSQIMMKIIEDAVQADAEKANQVPQNDGEAHTPEQSKLHSRRHRYYTRTVYTPYTERVSNELKLAKKDMSHVASLFHNKDLVAAFESVPLLKRILDYSPLY